MNQENIRNFCIIAHIDHGKSTLADRMLEMTNTISKRDMKQQTLDSMELEREKGITIKLKAVKMDYEFTGEALNSGPSKNNSTKYQLNLIDTPGHVDFAYEVSRSLAACEGAILVVDASQGIEAQTVSNVYKAIEANLTIIPVLNKIDLAGANAEKIASDLEQAFGFKKEEMIKISAKTGEGVDKVLEEIVKRVPAPKGNENAPLRAMVFDTYYDDFLGVIAMVRIVDGKITIEDFKNRKKFRCMATKEDFIPESLGVMRPARVVTNELSTGEVGYISTTLKDIKAVRVGDTISFDAAVADFGDSLIPLEGYKEVKPFVFVSIYPIENNKFPDLREALEKLSLSDASLQYEPESNHALGFGFRCGFLGLLHADIIQERLEREYNLELISTTPSVEYKLYQTSGVELSVKNASQMPDRSTIDYIEEPWILLNIVSPSSYTGGIITLCEERRGIMRKMEYPTEQTIIFEYELPLAELIYNFFDELKTVSSGYASIDYDFLDYRRVNVVRLDILVHGEVVDPLSQIVLADKTTDFGKRILKRLKDVLPRQQYKVALQAAVGGKIVAREDLAAVRKDVLAGIYGGHRERKDKLLERQKKGKDRMKKIGKVVIPQEAFRQVLGS